MSNYDYKIVYKKSTSINNLLREKSSKTIIERNNIAYNLNCGDCNRVYAGEAKRKSETRIKEHKNAITKPYMTSHVADNARETKHNINWDKPKISYHEDNENARLFLEKWNLEKLKLVMNKQLKTDTNIPLQYISLLKK